LIKLKKLYFDGATYASHCHPSIDISHEEIEELRDYDLAEIKKLEFIRPDWCNITMKDDMFFEEVHIEYILADISKKERTILYPSHNPTPNPGGLY